MRTKPNQKVKVKRILLYYQELDRLKMSHKASVSLMFYIFGISEEWIMKIIRIYDLKDLDNVKLEHWDLDLKIIDQYVVKIHKQAKEKRTNQCYLNL